MVRRVTSPTEVEAGRQYTLINCTLTGRRSWRMLLALAACFCLGEEAQKLDFLKAN
jgi:hypothetical protein